MPSTHTSLHVHTVFSTNDRSRSIAAAWREDLHRYIGGSIRGLGATPLEVGGIEDHVHILMGFTAVASVAALVREVKKASTKWVQDKHDARFRWQEGYGAFSVCRHELESTAAYIRGQAEHHRRRTFQEEYVELLNELGVEYDPRYLW